MTLGFLGEVFRHFPRAGVFIFLQSRGADIYTEPGYKARAISKLYPTSNGCVWPHIIQPTLEQLECARQFAIKVSLCTEIREQDLETKLKALIPLKIQHMNYIRLGAGDLRREAASRSDGESLA